MKALLRESLLHFVLLGAALFAFDALWSGRSVRAGAAEIVVSEGRVENLAALFAKTWQRPPTAVELKALVDDFVLEEALYREGVALGVDRDDTIIRRRVRQKMEFVVDDIIEQVEPKRADLEQWLDAHPEAYAEPARYRFRQLFLDPERHGGMLDARARAVLDELRVLQPEADPRGLGDPTLLEHTFPDTSEQAIAATFAQSSAEALAVLPSGVWAGPIESAFGLHLIHVDTRTPGAPVPLEQVRDELARDWSADLRDRASARYREGLLARYEVRIEWPAGVESGSPGQP